MLKRHMDAIENQIIASSSIQENTGHTYHKGTPREIFIKDFLLRHLPKNVSIGSGEIIDANSQPGQRRNQHDIIIYKNTYPKLDFGGNISGFFAEAVIATIEVKSTLTKEDLKKSIKSAYNTKLLKKSTISGISTGYIPPSILNYVIAYNGPTNIETVYNWIPEIHNELSLPKTKLSSDINQRIKQSAPSIDGIFILHKGFLYYDNLPLLSDINETDNNIKNNWVMANCNDGNLLLFFLFLQTTTYNLLAEWLDTSAYLSNWDIVEKLIKK